MLVNGNPFSLLVFPPLSIVGISIMLVAFCHNQGSNQFWTYNYTIATNKVANIIAQKIDTSAVNCFMQLLESTASNNHRGDAKTLQRFLSCTR